MNRPLDPLSARPRIPTTVYTNPFEMAFAIVLIVQTGRAVLNDITPSLAQLPDIIMWVYLAVSGLAGVALMAGLFIDGRTIPSERTLSSPISKGVAIERAALHLVGSSYTALALAVIGNNPIRGSGYAIMLLAVAGACFLRIRGIRKATLTIMGMVRARIKDDNENKGETR